MPEWWTYSPSDFLLFSPRTYYRLIERHNEALWPAQLLTFGLGVLTGGLLRRPSAWQGRVVSGILAVLWAWVAWAFVWGRYANINWAAKYFVGLFALEVGLLVWAGVIRGGLRFRPRRDAAGVVGIVLFVSCLAGYPLLAPLMGRGWTQAEVFGIAPDPTVAATLGLLLLVEGAPRWGLLVAPVVWCVIAGATLAAMGSLETWIMLPAAPLGIAAAIVRGRR
jgi:hypothetical protein